ncbi:LacI family DNA-binding transcriptional regulator [Rhizobium sp. RAF56]|uniref:LacI family DNA-binding transcriptional regulator n=1 Tax=Rhizobium sp. RAF56 TaxID=3233062 RepID=UPI003F9CD651
MRLRDVAERAGVSPITVSRALRNPGIVSEELRETVLRIVEEMGYTPDLAARALASRHSGVVGVLTPMLSQQVFAGTMRGIEDRMRKTDLYLQYANTAYRADDELWQTRAFLAHNPAGIIIAGAERYAELEPIIARAPCPVVHIIDVSQEPDTLAVGISHKEAAVQAVGFMLSRGYRRIAMIGGRVNLRARLRIEGYSQAMHEAGLFDEALILHDAANTGVSRGARLVGELLDRVPDLDGVFCQNDDVALGALFECQRRGIRVPEDFGVCGFNDLEFAAAVQPALTTVNVPRHSIGFQAADMLMRAIEGSGPPEPKLELSFTVTPRGTTR